MTIIWENNDTVFATSDPPAYDKNQYEGIKWINNSNKKQWFGSEVDWMSIDPAHGMCVDREDIELMEEDTPGTMIRALPSFLSLKKLLHSHNERLITMDDKLILIPELGEIIDKNKDEMDGL